VLCLGVAVQDYVFSLPAIPDRAEKYRASGMAVVGGGCAANAAVAVARLGGAALLATRLGADRLADEIIADLQAEGVDCRHAARFDGCQSSISAVMLDAAGERMVVNYRDAALPVAVDWLPDPSALSLAAVLADTRWPEGAAHLLQAARAAGLPAVLDGEAPIAAEAVSAASHIAFSRAGLADWAGTRDIADGLAAAADRSGGFVCVTDGAQGVHFRDGATQGHVPAFPVTARDTLGAGDVWHGAFALALAERRDAAQAIRFASAAAAIKCTRFGGRSGSPGRAEVETMLREH
jgi:sulfofructose kinase